MSYLEKYNEWLSSDVISTDLKEELKKLNKVEKEDSFYRDLEFGTAGLRGILGAGTNRMNEIVVAKTTIALAKIILEENFSKEKSVVIARDIRHKSKEFSILSAKILAKFGIKVYIFDDIRPTPILSYAVRYLNTIAGIMITASHNPKEYNGYKLYWKEGSQILEDIAGRIQNKMLDISLVEIKDYLNLSETENIIVLKDEVDKAYYEDTLNSKIKDSFNKDISIVYTPLNGCGNLFVRHILKERGFNNLYLVKEQLNPDPNFENVKSPNPENIDAFNLAYGLAKEVNADVVIATDPDSDRVRALGRDKEEYYAFTGNEMGYMLVNYILENSEHIPKNAAIVKTIVTSDLTKKICDYYNVDVFESLTGFKNICNYANIWDKSEEHKFIFGYEESIGYIYKDYLRDKDGIQISMLIAEMTGFYKEQGLTLKEYLENIYKKFGYVEEYLDSIYFEGINGNEKMKKIMNYFRDKNIEKFGNKKVVEKVDFIKGYNNIEPSNVLKFYLEDDSWFALRPSGTEPKMKIYLYVVDEYKESAKFELNKIKESILKEVNELVGD